MTINTNKNGKQMAKNEKQPLISIIVPCYNVEKYLEKCVDSIINQTYKNLEIWLVDDGSTDNTPKMCDDYGKRDGRIKVIHKENGGLVSARNAGYDVMTGEWHMYVDSDDWIDINTCEKLMELLDRYDEVDIVFWKCIQELYGKQIKGKWEWSCEEKEHLYSEEECHELSRNTLVYKSGIATAYCKLIRTAYAKKFDIRHDESLRQGAEGLEFSLRAFYYANKALYANNYLYHYRYNASSISKQINEANTKYLTDCFKAIENDLIKFSNQEIFKMALYQRVNYVLIAIAMNTYFHPDNKCSLIEKCNKYKQVIESYHLYRDSINKGSLEGMDKLRKITIIAIRLKVYCFLSAIAWLKQFFLKRGMYKY